MSHTDKKLKSVISLLRGLAELGTLEHGQKEMIAKEIVKLRGACRTHDPIKIRAAVDRVALIFLRMHGH